jgi:hypothetical protein
MNIYVGISPEPHSRIWRYCAFETSLARKVYQVKGRAMEMCATSPQRAWREYGKKSFTATDTFQDKMRYPVIGSYYSICIGRCQTFDRMGLEPAASHGPSDRG